MKEVRNIGDGIREAVFGANDGVVSTFGILAGLVGASLYGNIIVLVGIVQMFASGLSMGLGAYISTKSQNEFYSAEEAKQKEELDVHPAREKARVKDILSSKGLSGKTLTDATKSMTKDKKQWLHLLMEERFGVADTSYVHPVLAGGIMFFAFVIAGFFPVLPFIFLDPDKAIIISAILSLLILYGVGSMKTRFTHRNPFLSGVENLLIGAVTGVVGYFVGSFISALI